MSELYRTGALDARGTLQVAVRLSVGVHQHAANAKKTIDLVAWAARAAG